MGTGTGPGDVLQLIRRGQASTRTEVAELTGLSRVTVAQRVDALLAAGLVRASGAGASTGGRRPAVLRFNADLGVVLAASVDTTHARVAALDLAAGVLGEHVVAVDVLDGPERVLTALEDAMTKVLADAGRDAAHVEGVGVSLPAPVDPATGRPSQPPIMPGWDGYPVADHVRRGFDVPVVVENDANAMAAGEHAALHPDCAAFCLVKVSTGIGAGMVLGGRLFAGVDGGAGDIGHVRLPGVEAQCQCGSRGCLAAV
ncbi:ROK family transcriptional regulator, partial [Kineococcus glutinatus]|uniref:ROK family transcriptional regulator n=1 Tax=Kineococcus glutinatus TaxID=1070872 RepID=UPI0031ED2831